MHRLLIIFGAGRNGDDAYHFFGRENIFCFVDNRVVLTGRKLRGIRIFSFDELTELRKRSEAFEQMYEVIVSVSKTRWATLEIVNQLQQIGIHQFSIYMDIRKRWSTGNAFLHRDRSVYPYEQETILEIYRVQLDYLVRHTDAAHLLPATGFLREKQLETAKEADRFLEWIGGLNIIPFMISGTLLGAVRHHGFIPWDDDLDFGLIYREYVRLLQHMEEKGRVFCHRGNNVWETQEGMRSCSLEFPYIAAYGLGYMQIYRNVGAAHVKDNTFIMDIFPVYYFADSYMQKDYERDLERWYEKRTEDFDKVDREYLKTATEENIICEDSKKVGLGHDLTSFLKSQHEINGRKFNTKIWDLKVLYPLRKLKFEDYEWYAPGCAEGWLEKEGYGDIRMLPSRLGVYVHDKDRIFSDKY